MTRYQKLGILSVRWMAVGLFTVTAIWILALSVGAWAMGSMMGSQTGAGGFGHMMGGMGMGPGLFWGPIALTLLIGVLLYALSRPIGTAIGSGLED